MVYTLVGDGQTSGCLAVCEFVQLTCDSEIITNV